MLRLNEAHSEPKREMRALWSSHVENWATCLSWSNDALTCAVGAASGAVTLFDGRTGTTLATLDAHSGGVLDCAFSPNKRVLATAGQDGQAKLWNVDNASLIATLPGTSSWVEHLAWSPDGKNIATTSGKTVRLWTARGVPIVETEPHESTVAAVAFSRKGTDLATACYGGIRVFKIANGKSKHHAWKGSLVSLAWSPDDRVIACGAQDCSIHFWRLPSGKDSFMQGYRSKPQALAWSRDSTLLATSGESIVTVWDFRGNGPEGSEPIMLSSHVDLITDLSFHSRGTLLASGSKDAGVIVWDPRKGTEPIAFAFMHEEISKLAFRPNHEQLVTADASGAVTCWALPMWTAAS
jgi:WD40 repeat protein